MMLRLAERTPLGRTKVSIANLSPSENLVCLGWSDLTQTTAGSWVYSAEHIR